MKTDDMTKLAEANLSTQHELRKGMISNLSRMLYLVRDEVKKAFNIIDTKKKLDLNVRDGDKTAIYATIALTKEEYDLVHGALNQIRHGGYFSGLSNSRMFQEADNEFKASEEMLKKLQA